MNQIDGPLHAVYEEDKFPSFRLPSIEMFNTVCENAGRKEFGFRDLPKDALVVITGFKYIQTNFGEKLKLYCVDWNEPGYKNSTEREWGEMRMVWVRASKAFQDTEEEFKLRRDQRFGDTYEVEPYFLKFIGRPEDSNDNVKYDYEVIAISKYKKRVDMYQQNEPPNAIFGDCNASTTGRSVLKRKTFPESSPDAMPKKKFNFYRDSDHY